MMPGPSKNRNVSERNEKIKEAVVSSEDTESDTSTTSSSNDEILSMNDSDFDSSWDERETKPISNGTPAGASIRDIPPRKKNGRAVVSDKVKHIPLTRNFQPWEQRMMVRYLIVKRLISAAKGNRAWNQMIRDGHLTHRTALSLNNHFRKFILPNLDKFKMTKQNKERFRSLIKE